MVSSIDLQALKVFLNGPITHDMIHKIVVATLQVIPCQDTKSKTYTSSDNTIKQLPSLMTFLTKLVKYTNVYTGTLMATLIYLQKLKNKLPKNAHGLPCTRHRILLSCLILSSKFHNDSSPKNKHWAKYTDDINLMERQLIFLLNWDLKVTNEEMCHSLNSFLEPIKLEIIKQEKFKRYIKQKNDEVQSIANSVSSSSIASSVTSSPPSSRSSSISPAQYHYRQDSTSSISSMSSINTNDSSVYSISPKHNSQQYQLSSNMVDPIIEMTAQKEEFELKNFLSKKLSTAIPATYGYNVANAF
ncbi:PCL1 PHO85 cyclin-1 [Candida maltosa Xu316]